MSEDQKISATEYEKYGVKTYKMSEIFCDHTFNCRGKILPIEVLDIAKSISENGLDIPITIQPYEHAGVPEHKYRILAGHRRYMAFRVNGSDEIPAFIRTGVSEQAARLQNLRENLQRKQLNMKQEAHGLSYFFEQKHSETGKALFTDQELAEIFGQSRGWVQIRRDLLLLSDDLQDMAASDMFTTAHIRQLAKLRHNIIAQAAFVRQIKDKRAAGEKTAIPKSIKDAKAAYQVKERTRGEIMEINAMLYDMLGPGITTRFGAWCAGEISSVAFFGDLKAYCKDNGKKYHEPEWVTAAIAGTFNNVKAG